MPVQYQSKMTQRLDRPQFSRVRRPAAMTVGAILLALASGCASTSLDEGAPTASATAQTTPPASAPRPAGPQRGTASAGAATAQAAASPAEPTGPKDTGTYP